MWIGWIGKLVISPFLLSQRPATSSINDVPSFGSETLPSFLPDRHVGSQLKKTKVTPSSRPPFPFSLPLKAIVCASVIDLRSRLVPPPFLQGLRPSTITTVTLVLSFSPPGGTSFSPPGAPLLPPPPHISYRSRGNGSRRVITSFFSPSTPSRFFGVDEAAM